MNRDVRKLTWFIWRKFPMFKDWGRAQLAKWVLFHHSRAFTAVVEDRQGVIVAAGIARPIMNVQDAFDWCAFDQEGPVILVELVVAPSNQILRALGVIMKRRFGIRASIAFQRRRQRTVRMYPFEQIMRRITRMEMSYE